MSPICPGMSPGQVIAAYFNIFTLENRYRKNKVLKKYLNIFFNCLDSADFVLGDTCPNLFCS